MTVMMGEMTWPDYKARVQAPGAVVFLPVGSTEQHGHHMCLATDALMPTAIARMVAEAIGGIVAPPINYGYKSQPKSGGGNHYIGTTSLSAATLIGLIHDILLEFARHGARRVVVMNGHMENTMFLVEGIDLALADLRRDGITDMVVVKLDYYEFTESDTLAAMFPDGFPGWALEHAAVFETSLMLHLHPDMVDMRRVVAERAADFPPYDIYPTDLGPIPPSGVLSPAGRASAAMGQRMMAEYAVSIPAAVRAAFGLDRGE